MYYVDQQYNPLAKDRTFATLEEAQTFANSEASTDFENYYHYVFEVKTLSRAEPPKNPVFTQKVVMENLLSKDSSVIESGH